VHDQDEPQQMQDQKHTSPEFQAFIASFRAIVVKDLNRTLDTFRKWDRDNSGKVTKTEFRKAIRALGVQVGGKAKGVSTEVIDEAFDSVLDANHDGTVDYKELHRKLRRLVTDSTIGKGPGATPQLDKAAAINGTKAVPSSEAKSRPASDPSPTCPVQPARPRSSAPANTLASRDSSPRSSRLHSPPHSGRSTSDLHSAVPPQAQRKATSPFAPGAVWQHGATPRAPVSHRTSRNSHEYWHPPRAAPCSAHSATDSSSPSPTPVEQKVELNSLPPPMLKSPLSAARDFPSGSRLPPRPAPSPPSPGSPPQLASPPINSPPHPAHAADANVSEAVGGTGSDVRENVASALRRTSGSAPAPVTPFAADRVWPKGLTPRNARAAAAGAASRASKSKAQRGVR
jgi:hypothetical protein